MMATFNSYDVQEFYSRGIVAHPGVHYFLHIVVALGAVFALFLFQCRIHFPQVVGMMMPRLIMAIASSWIMFSATEEALKTSFDTCLIGKHWVWMIFLIAAVLLFMAVEIRNTAPDISRARLRLRVLSVFMIGLFYSALLGLLFTNMSAEKLLIRSEYLPVFYNDALADTSSYEIADEIAEQLKVKLNNGSLTKSSQFLSLQHIEARSSIPRLSTPILVIVPLFGKFEVYIFSGMLLVRTFFALFIGIFMQLIFESKPVTEPL